MSEKREKPIKIRKLKFIFTNHDSSQFNVKFINSPVRCKHMQF
jgi:hypothetical protein